MKWIPRTFSALLVGSMVCASGIALIAALAAGQNNSSPAPASSVHEAIVAHLNAVIGYYRDSTSKVQAGDRPSDAVYQDNGQAFAAEAVRLAFQSARAQAALRRMSSPSNSPGTPAAGQPPSSQPSAAPQSAAQPAAAQPAAAPPTAPFASQDESQNAAPDYAQIQATVSQRIADDQGKLEALNKKMGSAPPGRIQALSTQRDVLMGELTLDKATLDAVQKMSAFVEINNDARGGLQGAINDLARSIPEVLGTSSAQKVASPKNSSPVPAAAAPASTSATGLIGQVGVLYTEMEGVRGIQRLLTENANVRRAADELRQPLRQEMSATLQQGRDASNQTAGAAAPANAQAARQEFQFLTQKFNSLSGALLPLSQEIVVLDEGRSNLLEWRRSISDESERTLRSLLTRVVGLALALGVVLALSEIWRRLTYRYVRDARRRRQFMIIRRFVIGFLVGIVIILGFVSEVSSLATFAGFVTAGIAVGLQTVLLSVAAYFFVVGRYGIRVGERISVAGVTGDVIDVGLVRMYLMELAGTGVDLYPTGRIVVFSNSVLFQAMTPLFKQIPGTEYAWHELVMTLAPGADPKAVETRVLDAVQKVYHEFRDGIDPQGSGMDDHMEFVLKSPEPEAKVQFGDAGLELIVRYPVNLRRASEMDDRVTHALIDGHAADDKSRAEIIGTPKIRAAVKG
jgi:small-conductance mechanosensitive channel